MKLFKRLCRVRAAASLRLLVATLFAKLTILALSVLRHFARVFTCALFTGLLASATFAQAPAQVALPVPSSSDLPQTRNSNNGLIGWPRNKESISVERFARVQGIALSPSRRRLAIAVVSNPPAILMWGLTERKVLYELTVPDSAEFFNSLHFMPNGCCLLSGSSSGIVRLWDLTTKQIITSAQAQEKFKASVLNLSPDGKWLAVYGRKPTSVKLLHFPSLAHAATLNPTTESPQAHFTDDSKRLIITDGAAVSSCHIPHDHKVDGGTNADERRTSL
jgi:WD40 repeat protein